MASKRVLIVDDEENIGRSLRMILEREGYAVNVCKSVADFGKHPDAGRADAYLFDMKLPDGNGIDLLKAVRQNGPVAGHHDFGPRNHRRRGGSHARRRFRFPGEAAEPRPRPAGREERHRAGQPAAGERAAARTGGRRAQDDRLLQPAWTRAVEQATMAARSDARVLLIGESGTGKELLAAHIHNSSPFASGPFVKVNCAAIPTELLETELFGTRRGRSPAPPASRRGKFELADGGTIFLDEVGDLHARRKPSCCACCRRANSTAWAASRSFA
jgi:two-component system, NtrC family, nitrogen regulation response regulator NtrX